MASMDPDDIEQAAWEERKARTRERNNLEQKLEKFLRRQAVYESRLTQARDRGAAEIAELEHLDEVNEGGHIDPYLFIDPEAIESRIAYYEGVEERTFFQLRDLRRQITELQQMIANI